MSQIERFATVRSIPSGTRATLSGHSDVFAQAMVPLIGTIIKVVPDGTWGGWWQSVGLAQNFAFADAWLTFKSECPGRSPWRYLAQGEVVCAGDEVRRSGPSASWIPVGFSIGMEVALVEAADHIYRTRRVHSVMANVNRRATRTASKRAAKAARSDAFYSIVMCPEEHLWSVRKSTGETMATDMSLDTAAILVAALNKEKR
jgi:hypothetical protein